MASFGNYSLLGPTIEHDGQLITIYSFSLDASTDELQYLFQAPAALTITALGVCYASRVGTPPTYKISLQGISATDNLADGTIKGGASPASATFTPPADSTWNTIFKWFTLDNAYTTTRGEWLALVVKYDSGTVNGSNYSTFYSRTTGWTVKTFPRCVEVNAGTPAGQTVKPVFGYKTASASYGYPMQNSIVGPGGNYIDSGTTPDEVALKFTLPADWGSTFKVVGIMSGGRGAVATKTWIVTLYDTDGTTALQTVTCDSDNVVDPGSFNGWVAYFDETTLSTLNFGSAYRVSIAPQEASAVMGVNLFEFNSNADLSALGPVGSNWYMNTRTNAGSWTDDTSVNDIVPHIVLIIDDWTEPTAGGASPRFGDRTGGLR